MLHPVGKGTVLELGLEMWGRRQWLALVAQPQGQGGKEADRACSNHGGALRLPDLQTTLDLKCLIKPLLCYSQWLQQDAYLS